MRTNDHRTSYAVAAAAGILCGLASTHFFLVGSWLNLVFWGVVGAVIGASVTEKRIAARSGLLFGFFLTVSFLFFGFQGTPDKLFGFTLLTIALSFVGAGGGWLSAMAGNGARKLVRR